MSTWADGPAAVSTRFLEEVWSQGRLELIEDLVGPDVVAPGHLPVKRGPAGMRVFVSAFRTAFPDLRLSLEDQLTQGDRVATRWIARGTHRGPLLGVPATGRVIQVGGISIDEVQGGRIVAFWGHWDMLTMLEQIGRAPRLG